MARTLRTFDGADHPVSDAQAGRLDAAFGAAWPTEADAIAERDRLLALSQTRHMIGDESLGAIELAYLRACDDVVNMNRALRLMRGRDYREIFGPGATLDQVHHNRVHKACGCIINHIFDHNRRTDPDLKLHAHYLTVSCAKHAALAKDFEAHFDALTKE